MSPHTKFLWGLIVLLWVFIMFDPLHVLAVGIAVLLVAKIGGLSVRNILATTLKVGIGGIFIIVFQGLLYPGERVIFTLGPIRPTVEGLRIGTAIALRVLAMVAASITIAKTTDPRDVFISLTQIGVPYKIAYGLFAAIRFIPLMEYEAETIREAQLVRGITPPKKGWRAQLRGLANILTPLIACGIRRAQQSAAALDVRGFGLFPERTNLRKPVQSRSGWILVSVTTVLVVAYVLLTKQSILGALYNPLQ
jgi:energy-coupling factor transport system permease protein